VNILSAVALFTYNYPRCTELSSTSEKIINHSTYPSALFNDRHLVETRGRNNFARYKNTNVGQSGNSTYLSNHRSFCTTVEGWEDSTRCRTKDGLQRLLLVVNPLFKLKKRVHYWRFDCDAMMIQYIRHVTRLAHWKRCTWTIMHCFS